MINYTVNERSKRAKKQYKTCYDLVESYQLRSVKVIEISPNYQMLIRPSQLWLQNTPTASRQRCKTSKSIVFKMTLKKSDGKIPGMLSIRECEEPHYCHRSQFHSGLDL